MSKQSNTPNDTRSNFSSNLGFMLAVIDGAAGLGKMIIDKVEKNGLFSWKVLRTILFRVTAPSPRPWVSSALWASFREVSVS